MPLPVYRDTAGAMKKTSLRFRLATEEEHTSVAFVDCPRHLFDAKSQKCATIRVFEITKAGLFICALFHSLTSPSTSTPCTRADVVGTNRTASISNAMTLGISRSSFIPQ